MDSHARDIARLEAQLAESRAALAATLTVSAVDTAVGTGAALVGDAVVSADPPVVVSSVDISSITMDAFGLSPKSGSGAASPPDFVAGIADMGVPARGVDAAEVALSGAPAAAPTPTPGISGAPIGVIATDGASLSDIANSPQSVSADGGSDMVGSSNGSLDAGDLASDSGTLDGERDAIGMTELDGAGTGISAFQDEGILENTQIARHRRMLAVQQSMLGDQAAALAGVQQAQLQMHESLAEQARVAATQHAEDMAGIRAMLTSIASGAAASAPAASMPVVGGSSPVVTAPTPGRRVTMFGPGGLRVESVPEGRGEGGRAPTDLPTYNGELVGGSQARFEADFRRATALLGPRERAHYARAALRGIAKQKMDNKFATLGVPADAIVDLDYFFELLKATVTQHGQAHLTITAALRVKQTATGAASTAFENARDKFSEAGVPLQCPMGTDPAMARAYDRLMITVHHGMLQSTVQSELLRSPELFEGSFAAYQDQAVAIADSIRSQRSAGAVHAIDITDETSAAAAASMSGQWQQVSYAGSAGGGSGVPRMSTAIYRAPWSDCAGWAACSPHVTKCNYCGNHSDPRISATGAHHLPPYCTRMYKKNEGKDMTQAEVARVMADLQRAGVTLPA